MIDTDKEVKDILFNLGVEGNEYGDLVEYISKLLAEVKRLREENEYLRESDWEYDCLWAWLHENTDLVNTIEPILLSKWKTEWVEKSKEADE
jgi:hypothetical protein|tara:strand:+ start:166 stop:441 length:276 start_codon:yes stop_codon:yes gene_type:complete